MNVGRHGELEFPTCCGGFFCIGEWEGTVDLRFRRTLSRGSRRLKRRSTSLPFYFSDM